MTKNDLIRVAIDGPGGSGKSTIAKILAKELGIDYIDTGAMYRALALKLLRENIDMDNDDMEEILNKTTIDFKDGSIFLDGENVDELIRTPEISMMASKCSAYRLVREKLVSLQRNMGETKSVIMDGRDIGTNVLKNAEYKYYMTASATERANRRYKELVAKGESVNYDDVLADIKTRDYNDMTRSLNPLKKASDALEIDTTTMSIDQVIEYIKKEIK